MLFFRAKLTMNPLILHLKAGHAGIMSYFGGQGTPYLKGLLGDLDGGHLVMLAAALRTPVAQLNATLVPAGAIRP